MIKVTMNVDENGVIRGVSLWGHASQYSLEESASICFAVSSVLYTIEQIDPDGVRRFDKGDFCYEPIINTFNPTMEDEHKFTLVEFLITHLFTLASKYTKCFTFERRIIHYDN